MKKTLALISCCFGLLLCPTNSFASVPAVYTNENYWGNDTDTPVEFTKDERGNFSGWTVSGKYFTQSNIENSLSVRLQRFAIDEAYFYVSDKGIIKASSDTAALSIYLSRLG